MHSWPKVFVGRRIDGVSRMFRLQIFFALVVLWLSPIWPSPIFAQLPQVAESRLGVDSVKIEGGRRLYGFLLSRRADQSIVFSVGRKWLETTHPLLFAEFTGLEHERFKQLCLQRIERLEKWIENRPDDRRLVSFLEDELARFSELKLEEAGNRKFVTIELPATRYREVFSQPADRRKIAGLAFQNDIEAVTTTPVSQLQKQLVELGVDVETESVNLSKEVVSTAESDRQWAARKAVVEYALRKQLEFQGTGSMLIRKTETPDVSALVSQILGGGLGEDPISQLGAELGLPEFKKPKEQSDGWWKRATEEAERDGFCGVSITRLNQNMLSSTVTVEANFFAMEKPGAWFQVAKFSGQASTAEQTDEQLRRIQEDPQVKSVLDTLKGLGLGGQGTVEQALRHGAATQKALQDATGQFNAFITQNSRELDSQPIALQP
jgi:hypothetical protein